MAIGALFVRTATKEAEHLFLILVIGQPFAIVLCLLGTTILQHEDIFQSKNTYIYCGLLGALIAAAACMGFIGLGFVFWGIVTWGFLSGVVFRKFLGKVAE